MLTLVFAVCVQQVDVKWVDDEPRAVLAILQGGASADEAWVRLFATSGYRRLKDREAGMGRAFTDESFRAFVSSDKLAAQAGALSSTLDSWSKADVRALAGQALTYLPSDARIHATVYPLIKPLTNSFVWDTEKDPAIMLYLDPMESAEKFRKVVVHELHHIGYASCCPSRAFLEWKKVLKPGQRTAWTWLGAFGEGYAVLAAAGSADADPMQFFGQDVKDAWAHGISHMEEDMASIEAFVEDTVAEKIKGDEVTNRAAGFYGVQGPWYSVGYRMAVAIEKAYGRKALLECYQDPRKAMPTYNRAVKRLGLHDPVWSSDVMKSLGI